MDRRPPPRSLYFDPALVREDASVRELVSDVDNGRMMVALGDTDEDALLSERPFVRA